MDFIVAPTITAIVFYGIYKIFQLIVCRRERLELINKLGTTSGCLSIPQIESLPITIRSNSGNFQSLRWGSLIFGIGLGILVGYIICCNTIPKYQDGYNTPFMSEIVYGSCVFIFGGLSLLISFIVELTLIRKSKKEHTDDV